MALTKLTKNLIDGTFGTEWDSTIQTSNFTAVAGKGYFVNTTSAAITVTLPAGVVGNEIIIQDYAGTFGTNKVLVSANGSEKIQGSTDNVQNMTNNATITLVYQDTTKGWTSDSISILQVPLVVDYLVAAGGGGGASGYGGVGGGGTGPATGSGTDGTVNTGGGGGGAGGTSPTATGGAGGSGIVIIRYKYQ